MKYARRSVFLFLTIVFLLTAGTPAEAKDVWTQVRSKNFLLVGNASEKDIRKVGTRLEQFRETFRLLFSKLNFTAAIPTNVIVFKNDSSFKNFKPKRQDGKIDNFIAGFFQPGEDVNYITLSAEGDGGGGEKKLSVIFHEYVHFIINTNFGKSKVPPWFNEGLAEYYETFAIEGDQKIKLGLPQDHHLETLRENQLIPLRTLFAVSNSGLLEMPDRPRNIFYAESWALVHYLTQGGKADELNRFLQALMNNAAPEAAFQDVFKTSYEKMEAELRKYVGKAMFQYTEVTLKSKLVFENDMVAATIEEAETNAFLGDLLYHINRVDDSEPFLLNSLALKPASSMANATLGMVKYRQEKFDDALKYLEAAIADDGKNHIAYYRYAFLLSRGARDGGGMVMSFDPATLAKMRTALNKAIEINPAFTESYELLAFIDLVSGEQLDESVAGLKTALRYQPGNQRYALRIAEIYAAQGKFGDAESIAKKIAETSDDPNTSSRAANLVNQIATRRSYAEQDAANRKLNADAMAASRRSGETNVQPISDGLEILHSINDALRKPNTDEQRVIGTVMRIDCKQRPLGFVVKTPTETFSITSVDFASIDLGAFVAGADKAQVGCGEDLSALNAVITYRQAAGNRPGSRGDLVAIEFVPADFRFLAPARERGAADGITKDSGSTTITGTMSDPPSGRNPDEEAARIRMMTASIRGVLPKPADGQKQGIGFLDKIECSNRAVIFVLRTDAGNVRLVNSSPTSLRIGVYTPELSAMQFGCSIKPIEVPAVFTYVDKPDAKAGTQGEITTINFVPKGFTLAP
ncbi:MAG: tetratricopeptide repeat protein [Acidobacteriota bacterium]